MRRNIDGESVWLMKVRLDEVEEEEEEDDDD